MKKLDQHKIQAVAGGEIEPRKPAITVCEPIIIF
jgi:hypothetical protein